ncbi:MAG: phosphoesterase [Nitrospirales bacterium]|nr:MAG: phosphoesterase [Nitrospirales bacterium]
MKAVTTIGVISDTHGLMRLEALKALDGSALIIHAGDIGSPTVLDALKQIAPVLAVRGNNDRESWGQEMPLTEKVDVGGHALYVLHELDHLDFDPVAVGLSSVIYGHSHKPLAEHRNGVLYLNPGSAGPRRFRLPITVARLFVENEKLDCEIVKLSL